MTDTNKLLLLFFWLVVNVILTGLSVVSGGDGSIVGLTILGWLSWIFIIKNTLIDSIRDDKYYREHQPKPKEYYYTDTFNLNEFKSYMEERGFEVCGDIKKVAMHPSKTWMYFGIKVKINKSVEELHNEGIYSPLQKEILGKYYGYFGCGSFKADSNNCTVFDVYDQYHERKIELDDENDYIINVSYDTFNKIYYVLRRNSGLTKKTLEDMSDAEKNISKSYSINAPNVWSNGKYFY